MQPDEQYVDKPRLEIWGGVECTINRVGDSYFNQLARSGHRARLSDLDRFAELGLRTLRFPILWEELAPDSLEAIDWSCIDAQLKYLRNLGIKPIAGLLHHGSGPRYTSLLDPDFPVKLATFARKVAERYPWIDAFTPINEPLTTARFSALYGHWYPHARDGRFFARAFLNQIRGIVLAMRAIREINPRAVLVQTEDLGKTLSSSKLQYQADFENERRWLTWDLLCGRVDREGWMWSYLRWLEAGEREIAIFSEEPCPPQIIGVNHYVTSERYLDENLRAHPLETHGGNGRDCYADVAAVRVCAEGLAGPEALLRETCARYDLPVAATEAHLGCTREEQLRWLKEIWDAAQTLRSEGRNVCAVTAWSLLGAFDWNRLLTRDENHYEPGAFDVRGASARPTALARMIRALAHDEVFDHPALDSPGWWRRPVRLIHATNCERETNWNHHEKILITGGNGRLARAFKWAAELRGIPCCKLSRAELDIANHADITAAFEALRPWAVINCAGLSRVDAAEENEPDCMRSNTQGAELLARMCAQRATPLLTFSSDFVFGGQKLHAYLERDPVEPLNVYGESKALAETKIRAAFPNALIIRCGKIFAPFEPIDFLRDDLQILARGERVVVSNDTVFSPTHLIDLVTAALDLLIDDEGGVWHLANKGAVTHEELLVRAANLAELDTSLIEGVPSWTLDRAAPRPRNRALESERGQLLPSLDDALARFVQDVRPLFSSDAPALAIR